EIEKVALNNEKETEKQKKRISEIDKELKELRVNEHNLEKK
ncbi:hypothetical protein CP02DC14_1210, partial [Chlamydia psittaci 02DC14]